MKKSKTVDSRLSEYASGRSDNVSKRSGILYLASRITTINYSWTAKRREFVDTIAHLQRICCADRRVRGSVGWFDPIIVSPRIRHSGTLYSDVKTQCRIEMDELVV